MSDPTDPLTPAGDGRGSNGRFQPGNKIGKGNPLNARAQQIRAAILDGATDEDIAAIVKVIIDGAKAGDLQFIREWLDRTIGKPVSGDVEARLTALEQLLQERQR
jgi:hypothetical protein